MLTKRGGAGEGVGGVVRLLAWWPSGMVTGKMIVNTLPLQKSVHTQKKWGGTYGFVIFAVTIYLVCLTVLSVPVKQKLRKTLLEHKN